MQWAFGSVVVLFHVTIDDSLQVLHILHFDVVLRLRLWVSEVAEQQVVHDPLVHVFNILQMDIQ